MPFDPTFGDKHPLDSFDGRDQLRGQPRGVLYLVGMAEVLRNAGLTVIEYPDWHTRARSSGGYDIVPLCVMEHHTASPPSWDGQRDADYIAFGDEDAPLANLYIQRDGTVWVIAGGATNTNGKGQAMQFSRGTVPQDGMNSRAVGIECGNDGVGEPWPAAQVNALIATANACNRALGNQPTDIAGHVHYAPDRKIDPARAEVVQGSWQPRSINGSGSWDLGSMWEVHTERWSTPPVNTEDDPMRILLINDAGGAAVLLTGHIGTWLDPDRYTAFINAYGITPEQADTSWLHNVVMTGPLPTGVTDVWDQLD